MSAAAEITEKGVRGHPQRDALASAECMSAAELRALREGRPLADDRGRHVEGCESCQARLAVGLDSASLREAFVHRAAATAPKGAIATLWALGCAVVVLGAWVIQLRAEVSSLREALAVEHSAVHTSPE